MDADFSRFYVASKEIPERFAASFTLARFDSVTNHGLGAGKRRKSGSRRTDFNFSTELPDKVIVLGHPVETRIQRLLVQRAGCQRLDVLLSGYIILRADKGPSG